MREQLAAKFLAQNGWAGAQALPLPGDASRRRYTRLIKSDGSRAMLMDMPPHPEERFAEFLRVGTHLQKLGIRVPQIWAADHENGLALLEDLGDETITSQLAKSVEPETLYRAAVNILVQLHTQPSAAQIEVALFDHAFLYDEMMRFIDWRWPYFKGEQVPDDIRAEFAQLVSDLLNHIPAQPQTLVLRDYHAANLMVLSSGQLAVIDFQDAQIGHPAYDLLSLLEDARLDVPADLASELYENYLQVTGFDRTSFDQTYTIFAAQRHARLLGQFIRLKLRDGKDHYMQYLPRVQTQFERTLAHPLLKPLAAFIRKHALLT